MSVFDEAKENTLKVILATNAAESSLTIKDLDYVIDLGTHKAIMIDRQRNQEMLSNLFISKDVRPCMR